MALNKAAVEQVNALYELIESLEKDEKHLRAKIAEDDKPLKPEEIKLLMVLADTLKELRDGKADYITATLKKTT